MKNKEQNFIVVKSNGVIVKIHYVFCKNEDNSKLKKIEIEIEDKIKANTNASDDCDKYDQDVPKSVLYIAKKISLHLQGKMQNFNNKKIISLLDLTNHSSFAKNVLEACLNVKPQEIVTYGELAKYSGYAINSARAVGRVMSINPYPVIIPCHRVVAQGKKIGGFQGTKNNIKLKRKLLALEGKVI
ncbi:MAG: MGMT family protein [Oligoflexia bacterium]|nr:MGMT family protein [Oligoflexia bacterium]